MFKFFKTDPYGITLVDGAKLIASVVVVSFVRWLIKPVFPTSPETLGIIVGTLVLMALLQKLNCIILMLHALGRKP